jgi:thymidylate synthase
MQSFKAVSADEAWLLSVAALRDQSHLPRQDGRGGTTNELLHVVLDIHDSRQRWVVSRSPAMSIAFSIVEVIGILNGRRDSEYLNFFNPAVPKFAGNGPEYYGAYGFRLRKHMGFDQLERASKALTTNPEGRQVVLQIWDAKADLPSDNGKPVAEDIPCNICSMLKVREGKLEWSQVMRSNDIFKGLPYNFVQFMTLQEVLAGWIGVEPGSYTHFADSLHLYKCDEENVYSSTSVPAVSTKDSLALPKPDADRVWSEMNERVNILVQNELHSGQYGAIARLDDAPQSFTNLMAIVAADAARRRGNDEGVYEAIKHCKSTVLQQLWNRWKDRQSRRLVKDYPQNKRYQR